MLSDADLEAMAGAIAERDGVVGVTLGGSRARGMHAPDSDVDLGVYLQGDADESSLSALASEIAGVAVAFSERGAWGPWVDGGAWLPVSGTRVDWIRRDLDRVDEQWSRAQAGEHRFHAQAGHPLGFLDVAYCGELAHARILADPRGELASRQSTMRVMPKALADALVGDLWEAGFTLEAAAKAAQRGDAAFVGLGVSRAMLLCAHALHGRARVWATNEKGLVAAAARLPHAPSAFADRVRAALAFGDADARTLVARVDAAFDVVQAVRSSTR